MHFWLGLFILIFSSFALATPENAIFIQGGFFLPLYSISQNKRKERVRSFRIEKYPVTNHEFYEFLKKNPQWKPGKISKLKTDSEHLKHWSKGKPSTII